MRDRILALTGKRLTWIRTIHGTCAQILRLHIHKLPGYSEGFTIASTEQANKILKEAIHGLNINETAVDLADLSRKAARVKAQENPAEALVREGEDFVRIFDAYQERMRIQGCIDFNDLVYLTLRLFNEDAGTLSEVRNLWRHLIVDEVQDCDFAQYTLISLLGKERGIAVVGDDDQSIYSFRSATPEVLRRFVDDFSPEIITLRESFRLPKAVIAAANNLIKNNRSRFQKEIYSVRNVEGPHRAGIRIGGGGGRIRGAGDSGACAIGYSIRTDRHSRPPSCPACDGGNRAQAVEDTLQKDG